MKRIVILLAAVLLSRPAAHALTLDEALSLGKKRSLKLASTRIEHLKVQGQVIEAWSNALPQIEAHAGYQRMWKENVAFLPNFLTGEGTMKVKMQRDNSALADVTLNQPLLTFGRVSAGVRAAYAARRAQEHLAVSAEKSLELEIMQRFWSVLLMREVVEARRASLAISDSSLAKVRRMRDVGLLSDFDVLRVQVQAANQIPPLREAEKNLHLAELALKETLGIALDSAVTAEGTLDEFPVPPVEELATMPVVNRDDLAALRELEHMYRHLHTIRKNARWPILGGQVKYSWQWTSDKWAINPANNASSAYGGLALTIPIWSSGQVYGKAQQSKAEWQRAVLNLQQAQRGAELQRDAAVRSYHTATASEESARLAVAQATEARRIAQTKLEQGQITTLEMDAAQLDELVARVALAQARYERLVAAAEVRLATGLSPYVK